MEDNKEKINPAEGNNTTEDNNGPDPVDFGAAGVDDINKNVGQFTNTQNGPAASDSSDLKLDVDAKVIEKASNEEIDFERFSKTKKEHKHGLKESAPKTRFGEKVSMMLRTKKGLTTTWVLEIVIMVLIIIAGALLIAWLTPWLKDNRVTILAPETKVGIVFLWISLFPCLIPLIYLLTTWFIGINQVASSKMYHTFFWIAGAVSIACFIIGIGLTGHAMYIVTHTAKLALIATL